MEIVRSEGAQSTKYQQLQTVERQTRNNFRVPEIHFIHPVRRRIQHEIIFNPSKMAEISPENSLHVVQDKQKRQSPETSFCGMGISY